EVPPELNGWSCPSWSCLRLSPAPFLLLDQRVRLRRAPRARLVDRNLLRIAVPPSVEDWTQELPRHVDPIPARVQRGVSLHRVEEQTLVGLRRLAAEREVHLGRRDAKIRPRQLRTERERHAFVRLDTEHQQVRIGQDLGISTEHEMRRALESHRDL